MIVVVSPHLDDAALSLPGLLATRGEEVVVLTVCSEGDASYAERRAEDAAALGSLGVRAEHLRVLDAPFRRGVERSFRGLIHAEVGAGDVDAAVVGRAICGRVAALRPEAVVLPLGVGEHVDHRVVHTAHAGIRGAVAFYEDRPYASVRHAVRARLARLGARVDGVVVEGSEAVAREFLAAAREAAYVRAYVPAGEFAGCMEPLAAPLIRPAAASGLALRCEARTFSEARIAAGVRAVGMYASQLEDLFGGAGAVASAYASPYAERLYWRL